MNIFDQIVKHRERFIDMQGYRPSVVYLGMGESLALDKWAQDNLPFGLDVSTVTNKPSKILGMDIYVVDAVSHMVMI